MRTNQRILVAVAALALGALAAVSGPACKKKAADVTPGQPAAVLQAAPKAHPAVEQSLGALPPGVVAVVGIQSLDAVRAASKQLQDTFGLPAGVDPLQEMGVPPEIAAAIDPARPLFAAATQDGFAAAVPVKDPAPLQAAASDGSGLVSLVGAPPDAWAYVAGTPESATTLRPVLDKARASLKPQALVQALVPGQALREAAQPVLDDARREFLADLELSAQFSPLPMGKSLVQFYGNWFDRIGKVLDEIELLDLRLGAPEGRLRLESLIAVKDGGALRKLVAHGEAKGSAAAGLLPPNAWAVMAANIDPALFEALKADSMAMMTELTAGSGTPSYDLAELYETAWAVQTGDWAMALYQSEGFPFAFAAAALTTDGARYQQAMEKFSALYLGAMESGMGSMPGAPPVDFSSWERLFDGINSFSKPFGLSVEADSDGDVSGVRVGLNWNQLPMGGDPQELAQLQKIWGSKWELAFGFGPVVVSGAFGPTAFADAQKMLQGGFTYADEAFRASMSRGAAHPFLVTWVDTGRASVALADMVESVLMMEDGPSAKEIGAKLRAAKPGDAIAFTMGGSGTTLHAVLDVPLAPLKELQQVVR